MLDEIVYIWIVCDLVVAKVPPSAANKIGYDHSNDYESENLVDIQQEVMLHNPFVSRSIAHQGFQQFIKPRYINQLNESRQPKQSEQLGHITLRPHQHLERKHRDEVNEEPAMKHIVLRNTLQIFHNLISLRMLVALQEIQGQIQPKEKLDYLVNDDDHRVVGGRKRGIKHGSYTGVAH